MTWKPRPREGADHLALPIQPEQGYLLSRLDGTLDVPSLAALMNMDEDRVTAMLGELVALGAVASLVPPPLPPVHLADEPPLPGPPPEEAGDLEDTPAETARAATHRQRFETHLHSLPLDQRVAQARAAGEPDLSAFCFDPTLEVVRSLLENPRTGLVQARLIAAHHRTAAGLELLGGRGAFAADDGVRRALLQNPLLPAGLYRRLWAPRRLLEQYLVATSREAPEQVRAMARDLMRASFNQRVGEERAEFILATEGRCLASLVGLTLDSHATAILCRRTYTSTLLIQNLARWSAAPPALIAHLRRQDLVRRNPVLRQMVEPHPTAT